MNTAPNLATDQARAAEGTPRATRLYTPSFSDGLGDRLLTFDNATGMSLELLRFKKEFSDSRDFETALRERIEQLAHLHHPSLSTVRSVERLEGEEGLAVVSKLTPGRRLCDLVPKARGPVFALEFLRQLAPALAALHQSGEGVAHGALTADRIVVAREGRLVIVDHVLGSALQTLRLPAARLRAELGLATPAADDPLPLNPRTDVIQLGFVALSLVLGRKLDPADYPANIGALLDEFVRMDSSNASGSARLRKWLERTLQIHDRPFASAREANEALGELPSEAEAPQAERTLLTFRAPGDTSSEPRVEPKQNAKTDDRGDANMSQTGARTVIHSIDPPPASPKKATAAAAPAKAAAAPVIAKDKRARRGSTMLHWAVIGLSVIAAAEGVFLVVVMMSKPAPIVVQMQSPRANALASAKTATSPLALSVGSAALAPPPAALAPAPTVEAPPPAAAPPPPPGGRFGGIRLSSAIELQVYENGKLIGSTAGPIAMAEGPHDLDLTNEAFAYRSRETVTVKGGQMTPLTIAVPNGRISINAVPWAEVTIDGNAAGQTPIANFSLSIGQHEIVFRHPQFGEQRQMVVVKAEGLTRVSANLQK